MRVFLAHRIRLVPNAQQERYFIRACGVARFAYNWALAEWERGRLAGEHCSEIALRRRLNAIKIDQFPWMTEVTKNAPQQAIKNLGRAYKQYFENLERAQEGTLSWRRVGRPQFKRKGHSRDAFRADSGPEKNRPDGVRVNGKRIKLPKAGWVRMREALRFRGRIMSVVVSRRGGRWYASVTVEVDPPAPVRNDCSAAGCDLGLSVFATIFDGSNIVTEPGRKPLRGLTKRLARLNRAMHRKKKGSRNWVKAKTKLAHLHAHVSDARADALHKLTSRLVRDYRYIGVEDLNPAALARNKHIARSVHDQAFAEFRRHLTYKARLFGATIVLVDRWFPSSKRCSACGTVNGEMSWGVKHWQCRMCGVGHQRDENAARNLYTAASSAVAACGANGSGEVPSGLVKLFAAKQEGSPRRTGTVRRSQVFESASLFLARSIRARGYGEAVLHEVKDGI
jgi:putative transposase